MGLTNPKRNSNKAVLEPIKLNLRPCLRIPALYFRGIFFLCPAGRFYMAHLLENMNNSWSLKLSPISFLSPPKTSSAIASLLRFPFLWICCCSLCSSVRSCDDTTQVRESFCGARWKGSWRRCTRAPRPLVLAEGEHTLLFRAFVWLEYWIGLPSSSCLFAPLLSA